MVLVNKVVSLSIAFVLDKPQTSGREEDAIASSDITEAPFVKRRNAKVTFHQNVQLGNDFKTTIDICPVTEHNIPITTRRAKNGKD